MSSNTQKYSILFSILSFLIITSCSSLYYGEQNKTDRFKDVQAAKGNKATESISLGDMMMSMLEDNGEVSFAKGITYEVALKQFSIMPLISVDRVGGTIITDWFSTSSNNNERVKFNIFIKDEKMTNESIEIKMFKETLINNNWLNSTVDETTASKIKSLILKKALQLQAAAELS